MPQVRAEGLSVEGIDPVGAVHARGDERDVRGLLSRWMRQLRVPLSEHQNLRHGQGVGVGDGEQGLSDTHGFGAPGGAPMQP